MSGLRLVPFTGADLQAVEAWFDDPETCRWLGDRRWPEMILGWPQTHQPTIVDTEQSTDAP